MFKIEQDVSVKWPVEVFIPRDGGKKVKATFTAEFKVPTHAEVVDMTTSAADDDKLAERLAGWTGVQDTDGSDVPYSEEAKTKLLSIPYVRAGVAKAFFKAINGASEKS